jgi:hypothetical protein
LKKTKSIKKTESTRDGYLDFLRHAALQGIGLDNATMSVDRNALAEATARGETLPVNLDAKFSVGLLTDDRIIVNAEFVLKNSRKDDSGEVISLMIACSFSALFNLGSPCDGESANHFANAEAKLIFWPYLRHFVSDTTYRMAISPITIPLMTAGVETNQS